MTGQEIKTRDEARRLKCYRVISKVERVEETLRALYEWSKGSAVTAANANNPQAFSYWTGRADGIEDLMARLRQSKKPRSKHPPGNQHAEDKETEIL